MKNLKVVMLAALAAVGLAGCGECQHVDENHDHKCDKCDVVMSQCEDKDPKDHLCDWCGAKVSEHQAAESSHDCVICGEKISEHKDDNHDHNCDICGTKISEHVDSLHDGECDICGIEMEVHHVDDGTGYCSCGKKIVLESAVLNVDAAKKVYGLGEKFDPSGVKVIGTYTDEQVKEVECTCSTPDMSTVGQKQVTVTYLDKDGAEQHFYFTIDVSYWSEGDLELMDKATLLKYADPLPYLPGMRIESDLVEGTWNVLKEDSSLDELDQYWELMNDYSVISTISSKQVDFTMVEYPTTYLFEEDYEVIKETYGFSEGNFYVFCLIPSYVDAKYGPRRFFVGDEYFIFGLTDEGDFKLYDRFIEAYFDGYWDGNENCELDVYDVAKIKANKYTVAEFISELSMPPYYYFSEFVDSKVTAFPDMAEDTGLLIFNSFKTYFPFDFSFDQFVEAVSVDLINGSEAERNALVDNLLKLGYVEDGEISNLYSFENEYVGTISYYVSDFDEHYVANTYGAAYAQSWGFDAGYSIEFYYEAPERDDFVTVLTPALDSLLELFGENVNYLEIDTDYYDGDGEGEIIADFYVVADEAPLDSEAVEASLAALLPAGFYSYGPAEYNSKYECWEEEFTNGTYGVYLSVFDADEDGDCEVYLELYYGEEIIETFTNKVVSVAEAFTGSEITPVPITGGYGMSAVVGATGGKDTAESLLDTVYNGYVYYGLVAEGGESEEIDTDDWAVTVLSYDGQFEVMINVYDNGKGAYACIITIVSAAPWTGTAEELMLEFASQFGGTSMIEPKDDGYAIEGVYFVQSAYLDEYEEVLVTSNIEMLEGLLPRGMVTVQDLAKDPTTGLWSVTYTTADGTVTLRIDIEWYEVVSGGFIPLVNIYTYPTVE